MIKYLKQIKSCVLKGLFISLIIFASASVFDKELSEKYERFSHAKMISDIFDDETDAVLTDAFLHDVDSKLFSKDNADHQVELTRKYILSITNTKIITAYKLICKTHLNLRPILYSGSKIYMSSYQASEEYPLIS
jgi:hypothetical protein